MYETHINKRILEKIKHIDDSDKFKKLLVDLLEFEKIQIHLGDKEYSKKYDGAVTRFMDDIK